MNFVRRLFSFSRLSKRPWWIKIKTQAPNCLYYFGPFDSQEEAEASQFGYVEDLLGEGAQAIETVVENAVPKKLTVCNLPSALAS
ncbi:MAG: DUF1816 domain-containing protein [Phormidesmis sp.]